MTEAKVLLLEVCTTTLSPCIWHNDVSSHDWGQVSTARGQLYYIESQYLTQLGQYTSLRPRVYCKRSVLLHWVPVSDTKLWVHMTEAKFLLLEVCTTTLSLSIWHKKSVHITEAKFRQLEVNTTTLSPSIWHMKSEHIIEAKYLLLEVSTTTLSPCFWHHDVSTHDSCKVSTARGQ